MGCDKTATGKALRGITDELRRLAADSRVKGVTDNATLEAVGMLLRKAVNAGAFREPKYNELRGLIDSRRDYPMLVGYDAIKVAIRNSGE